MYVHVAILYVSRGLMRHPTQSIADKWQGPIPIGKFRASSDHVC
jgi:hypothetical protein